MPFHHRKVTWRLVAQVALPMPGCVPVLDLGGPVMDGDDVDELASGLPFAAAMGFGPPMVRRVRNRWQSAAGFVPVGMSWVPCSESSLCQGQVLWLLVFGQPKEAPLLGARRLGDLVELAVAPPG